jgi:hypothetical protein
VFRVTGSYGFHVTFSNGVTASVQFSNDHCCSARHQSPRESSCPNAEVAFFRDDTWLTKEIDPEHRYDDRDIGYVNSDDLVPLLVAAAAYPAWVLLDTMFVHGQTLEIYGRVAGNGNGYDRYKATFNGHDIVTSPGLMLSRVVVTAYFAKHLEMNGNERR